MLVIYTAKETTSIAQDTDRYMPSVQSRMTQEIPRLALVLPEEARRRQTRDAHRLQYILDARASHSKSIAQVCQDLSISKHTYYKVLSRAGIRISADAPCTTEADIATLERALQESTRLEGSHANTRTHRAQQPATNRRVGPRGDSRGTGDRERTPETPVGRD